MVSARKSAFARSPVLHAGGKKFHSAIICSMVQSAIFIPSSLIRNRMYRPRALLARTRPPRPLRSRMKHPPRSRMCRTSETPNQNLRPNDLHRSPPTKETTVMDTGHKTGAKTTGGKHPIKTGKNNWAMTGNPILGDHVMTTGHRSIGQGAKNKTAKKNRARRSLKNLLGSRGRKTTGP